MSDDMVERVARAVDAVYFDPGRNTHAMAKAAARTAIEAMRTPLVAMCEQESDRLSGLAQRSLNAGSRDEYAARSSAVKGVGAIIDEALATPPEPPTETK